MAPAGRCPGYQGRGGRWAEEGEEVDRRRLMPPRGFEASPRRRVVGRTFSRLGQNRRMGEDYERLPEGSEALV